MRRPTSLRPQLPLLPNPHNCNTNWRASQYSTFRNNSYSSRSGRGGAHNIHFANNNYNGNYMQHRGTVSNNNNGTTVKRPPLIPVATKYSLQSTVDNKQMSNPANDTLKQSQREPLMLVQDFFSTNTANATNSTSSNTTNNIISNTPNGIKPDPLNNPRNPPTSSSNRPPLLLSPPLQQPSFKVPPRELYSAPNSRSNNTTRSAPVSNSQPTAQVRQLTILLLYSIIRYYNKTTSIAYCPGLCTVVTQYSDNSLSSEYL